ncbi:universal stress protein [Salinarimonas rosea]|uniref:universal stress protein n=1 Tax=Salinarimonas rosea TaxID=552063 RepID=UPI0004292D00|nr:universal stress protein [Salinarimonas rosea]
MYRKILTPIDLAHRDRLAKAVDTAIDLARHWAIPVVLVGVTEAAPSAIAHNPQEYARKLAAFAEETAQATGVAVEARAYTAHDPATQIDETILKAVADTGADLVVMASHAPTIGDALVPSHGGRLASHTAISVFLVR